MFDIYIMPLNQGVDKVLNMTQIICHNINVFIWFICCEMNNISHTILQIHYSKWAGSTYTLWRKNRMLSRPLVLQYNFKFIQTTTEQYK